MIHNKYLWLVLLSLHIHSLTIAQLPIDNYSLSELDSILQQLVETRQYQQILPYAQVAVQKAEKTYGKEDTTYARMNYFLGTAYYINGQMQLSETHLKIATAIQGKIPNQKVWLAKSLNTLGIVYWRSANLKKALQYCEQAKDIFYELYGERHATYTGSLNNLGILSNSIGDYDKAVYYYTEALRIRKEVLGQDHPEYSVSLNNLATLYNKFGEYDKARPLYKQALALFEKRVGKQHPDYAIALNNLGNMYVMTENHDEAEKTFKEALQIRKETLGENHPDYAGSLNSLALVYSNTHAYNKSLPLYLEAMQIRKKAFGDKHPIFAESLNNIAFLYNQMGEYEKALPLYKEAFEIKKSTYGNRSSECITATNNLATVYSNLGQLDLAWENVLSAIWSNTGLKMSKQITKAWCDSLWMADYLMLDNINSSLDIIYLMLEKTPTSSPEKSLMICDLGIRLMERNKNNLSNESDKMKPLKINYIWTLRSLENFDVQKETDKAFALAEGAKSVLLREAIQTEHLYSFGNIPDSITQTEKNLYKLQATLKGKIAESLIDPIADSLRGELVAVNLKIDDFRKNIKAKYPDYAASKYEKENIKTSDIQAILRDKEIFIEYLLGDSVVYIFHIDKKNAGLDIIYIDNLTLKNKIQLLHHSLSDYEQIGKDPEKALHEYSTTAYWFYNTLLKPVLKDRNDVNHIIIVPDGELAHLPFESFLVDIPSDNQSYADFHYLIRDYKVSYQYAGYLWTKQLNKKLTNNGALFALAANYDLRPDSNSRQSTKVRSLRNLRDALQALPAAREEVETLQKSFSGFFGYDNDASEKNFKAKAGEYAIIHLAMHGLLNEKRPILSSLAFTEDGDSVENNFLQAYEISKMELNADLVVLSACETGFGKFETGNGTASLARAFMYAGVPAMVVSLWQVNDASTSLIMQSFYKNLAKGMDKASALQEAKLTYIKNADDIAAHPAFWAPFIQLGDSRPITVATKGPSSLLWWLAGGIGGLLALGGIAFLMRRKPSEV